MKTLDALIATLKQAKEELAKAIKPGPTLDYSKINPKPDRAAQEAAAPTIDYGDNRMSTPKVNVAAGAAERAAAIRVKLESESKETALETINRKLGKPNKVNKADEPHEDDPKHEEKEKKKAAKIKEQAQEILDMHKGCDIIKANQDGQWYLEKAETIEEFKARGGRVQKIPANKTPKTFDAKPTKSVSGVYNTGSAGYKKGGPGVPAGMKKEDYHLEKDNSVKPFGQNIYNATANIKRKANRTGEEVEGVGRNAAVHNYTTSGSSMSAAHEAAQAKEMKAKAKASVRTMKDMSPEELAAIQSKQGKK